MHNIMMVKLKKKKSTTNLGNQESSGMMKLFMPRPKVLAQYESIQFMP
ncbi:Down syndrome critical region gene 8, isoform CRA_b [Homo sapiens]|uniref:Isoform 6 of Down syndrome critical region protein 8 n=1 Tax=Homo sapiens TaxID=9606 RepID=Q96T75-6|nr:Down syndrome critical region gene 8, isoform CRA_b [Homo sapiens]CAH03994.1 malignant melanoma associated protein [Homo sapiens]